MPYEWLQDLATAQKAGHFLSWGQRRRGNAASAAFIFGQADWVDLGDVQGGIST